MPNYDDSAGTRWVWQDRPASTSAASSNARYYWIPSPVSSGVTIAVDSSDNNVNPIPPPLLSRAFDDLYERSGQNHPVPRRRPHALAVGSYDDVEPEDL